MCFTHTVNNIHVCCASDLYFTRLIALFFILIHHPLHLQPPHVQSLKFNNVWHSICGYNDLGVVKLYTKTDAITIHIHFRKCDL